MSISEVVLNTRFGYGIRPGSPRMTSISGALRGLTVADPLDWRFKRPSMQDRIEIHEEIQAAKRDERNKISGAEARYKAAQNKSRSWVTEDMRAYFSRAALSE